MTLTCPSDSAQEVTQREPPAVPPMETSVKDEVCDTLM